MDYEELGQDSARDKKRSNKIKPMDEYDTRETAKNPILDNSMKSGDDDDADKSMPNKMRLLDRSQLMDMMLFPQNCKKMCIVPSNKEGTGFLNHCYDKQYLVGFITEKEFNAIILICSRIAARAYSQK